LTAGYRIDALREIAQTPSGVTNRYEVPVPGAPWLAMAREILEKGSYEKIDELRKEVMRHPRGVESVDVRDNSKKFELEKSEMTKEKSKSVNLEYER
jgi:hypothetical protein